MDSGSMWAVEQFLDFGQHIDATAFTETESVGSITFNSRSQLTNIGSSSASTVLRWQTHFCQCNAGPSPASHSASTYSTEQRTHNTIDCQFHTEEVKFIRVELTLVIFVFVRHRLLHNFSFIVVTRWSVFGQYDGYKPMNRITIIISGSSNTTRQQATALLWRVLCLFLLLTAAFFLSSLVLIYLVWFLPRVECVSARKQRKK